jgi:hypothetical protein
MSRSSRAIHAGGEALAEAANRMRPRDAREVTANSLRSSALNG